MDFINEDFEMDGDDQHSFYGNNSGRRYHNNTPKIIVSALEGKDR